jgi:tetratricopeptide (TPR) repeat protein
MENLQELIKSLSKSEKKTVRKFLSVYSSKGKSETLGLQLFDLLNKRKKILSNKDCSILLFKQDEKNRIRVIKSRLKQRILDALTTDIVLNNQSYDLITKKSFQLKKKFQQAQFLLLSNKGNIKTILSLVDEVIKKSKKYEQFNILIDALNLKKMTIGYREGIESYLKYEKQIEEAKQHEASRAYNLNAYYIMILMYRTSNPDSQLIQNTLKEYIEMGDSLLFKANSQIGQYYLNIIKCGYYMEIKEHRLAIHVMKNQLTLLNKSEVVYRKIRVGATHDYLSESYINLGNYDSSAENAKMALKYFEPNSINHNVAQQLLFRAKLYSNKLNDAENLIKEITKFDDAIDTHRVSTNQFFLSNLYFAKKDYKKCNRLLSQDFNFKQDKTGWEFSTKILHVMCLIEQDKIEEADVKLTNLIRVLKKYDEKEISSRNHIIIDILKVWLKSGGNKHLNPLKNNHLIDDLRLKENLWDPMQSELIQFENWINTKI